MRILRGKNILEISSIDELIAPYASLAVDIGTGDGKFAYRLAKENPQGFFIGIDSAAENMKELSVKSMKKPNKGGLPNVLFAVANAEALPEELDGRVDSIHVNMPWGSLLEGIVKAAPAILDNIVRIAAPGASFETNFTYSDFYEEAEMVKRELPELSIEYIENTLIPAYQTRGITITEKNLVGNEALKELGTQWSKKLGFGRSRAVFRIKGIIHK